MFDIGFSEIVVIAVVALVVIGPERLPKTARTLGHLFGRLQRYVSDVKADISREMELDELRKLQREMQGAAREFEQIGHDGAQRRRRPACATSSASSTTRPPRRGRRRRVGAVDRREPPAAAGTPARRAGGAPGAAARLRQDLSATSVPAAIAGAPQRRSGPPRPRAMSETPITQETFMSHLIELRTRLHALDHRRRHRRLLCCSRSRRTSTRCSRSRCCACCRRGATMIATDVTGTFLVPLKVTLMAAFLIALPYVLWQAWAFVAPGLYQHEKRLALPVIVSSCRVLRARDVRSRISSCSRSRSASSPATRRPACR